MDSCSNPYITRGTNCCGIGSRDFYVPVWEQHAKLHEDETGSRLCGQEGKHFFPILRGITSYVLLQPRKRLQSFRVRFTLVLEVWSLEEI